MLDTHIVIDLIRHPAGPAAQRARAAGEAVCVSVIVAEEFLSAVRVVPFDVPADTDYGALRAELEAAGRPIGSNDLLIAAHARQSGMTVVTANVGEFGRVRGLNVENWLT
jgi:tRNA(fMet)-specific endonuclease VapC